MPNTSFARITLLMSIWYTTLRTFGSTCPALCWYGQAYPQLRKLAEFGLIEWYPAPTGGRPAAWRLATPDTDDAEPDQSEVAFGVDVIDLDTPTPPRED